jgi:hypothetical protein
MATTHLQPDCTTNTVIDWYHGATVGDTAVIAMPSRAYTVRLIRQARNQVHWWPQGGRGMTMPLEDAVYRLQMLCSPSLAKPRVRVKRAGSGS